MRLLDNGLSDRAIQQIDLLYSMEIHQEESIDAEDWFVLRVPGGWIYYETVFKISHFVPQNEAYKKRVMR